MKKTTSLHKNETALRKCGFKTVSALCNAAGVSRAALSEIKAGRTKHISLNTAMKLSVALGVTIEEIVTIDSEPT
ncbi:helix-turn-helix transcriptional regulator [Oscillospiraceae bacterium OttesenSCG-928-G22]|nr:helix-turn-helix transcriptional regulator [Oscillospiraceae bacterium OttesenSCG-928-G22]